jgi:hypothetical protein
MDIYFNSTGELGLVKTQLESRKIYFNYNLVELSKLDYSFFKENKSSIFILKLSTQQEILVTKNILPYITEFNHKLFIITDNVVIENELFFIHNGTSLVSNTENRTVFLNKFLLSIGVKLTQNTKFPIQEKLELYSLSYLEKINANYFTIKTNRLFNKEQLIHPLFSLKNMNEIQYFTIEEILDNNQSYILKIKPQFDENIISFNQLKDKKQLDKYIQDRMKKNIYFDSKIFIFSRNTLDNLKIRTKNIKYYANPKSLINDIFIENPDFVFYDFNDDDLLTKLTHCKILSIQQCLINPFIAAFFNSKKTLDSKNIFINNCMTELDINVILYKSLMMQQKDNSLVINKLNEQIVYFKDTVKVSSINPNQISFFSEFDYLLNGLFIMKNYNFILKLEEVKKIANKYIYVCNIISNNQEHDENKLKQYIENL